MGRPKEPIDLIIAKGKKNLTKEEIAQRRAEELDVPFKSVTAPSFLPQKLAKQFDLIAEKLLAINIMTELDEDVLARYLIASDQYERLTKKMNTILRKRDTDWDTFERLQKMQDRSFKQCQATAQALGLTISSRARLVVPEKPPEPTNKFVDKFKLLDPK